MVSKMDSTKVPTYVTAYFPVPGNRSVEFYLQNGKKLLQLDISLIVYCDSEIAQKLKPLVGARTEIRICNVADWYPWSKLDAIRKNRIGDSYFYDLSGPEPKLRDRSSDPEYFAVTVSKFEVLRDAASRVSDETRLAWIDFGLAYATSDEDLHRLTTLEAPSKFRCCYMHWRPKNVLINPSLWYSSYRCGMAARLMTASSSVWIQVADLIKEEFHTVIDAGYGHAEERLLSTVYARRPDLFSYYLGDYNSSICNYDGEIRAGFDTIIKFFLSSALDDSQNELVRSTCVHVLRSKVEIPSHLRIQLYQYWLISAWYTKREECVVPFWLTVKEWKLIAPEQREWVFKTTNFVLPLIDPKRTKIREVSEYSTPDQDEWVIVRAPNWTLDERSFPPHNPMYRPN
jgi:hypothetical protein